MRCSNDTSPQPPAVKDYPTKEAVMSDKDIIRENLFFGKIRGYLPMFAEKYGGVEAGVFLSNFYSWSGGQTDPTGWIYKTQEKIQEETGLSRRNQETARRKLREAGVLEESLRGIPATLNFRINWDKLLADFGLMRIPGGLKKKADSQLAGIQQTSMADSAILDCTNPPNLDGGTSQSISVGTSVGTSGEQKTTTLSSEPPEDRVGSGDDLFTDEPPPVEEKPDHWQILRDKWIEVGLNRTTEFWKKPSGQGYPKAKRHIPRYIAKHGLDGCLKAIEGYARQLMETSEDYGNAAHSKMFSSFFAADRDNDLSEFIEQWKGPVKAPPVEPEVPSKDAIGAAPSPTQEDWEKEAHVPELHIGDFTTFRSSEDAKAFWSSMIVKWGARALKRMDRHFPGDWQHEPDKAAIEAIMEGSRGEEG